MKILVIFSTLKVVILICRLSGNDNRVAPPPKLYLTASGIIIQGLKLIETFRIKEDSEVEGFFVF